ncbi:MAG: amino acid adenylation domain-containing protein [Bacteroidetes bacterium]|nr:amino acid adenylation domain-containing protein [Bacteroidota bacterium]
MDRKTEGVIDLFHEFPGMTSKEADKILNKWNNTTVEYPSDKCVHHLFEEQVLRSPDAIAVVYEGEQVTYSDLNFKANRLAHFLVKQGAYKGTIIALCLERGVDMIAGLLAISKTGASYLPLDPIYPKARQELVLEDARPVLFLTQRSLLDKIPHSKARILLLDEKENYVLEPEDNLDLGDAMSPLYILFTSGSTGKPKGVPVLQRSTVNVVNSFSKLLRVSSSDILFTVTTIAFDLAELDIYLALLNGAKLVLGSLETAMSMDLLSEKLATSGATIFQATPVTHRMLIQSGWKGKPDLKIISGGEAMTRELAGELLARTKEVWNCYGPTETTIYNTARKVTADDESGEGVVSIGRPFDNNKLYVLNADMLPVRIGVPGELFIGGDGLSPGYLNNPEMTAAKFVRNPFSENPDERIYRSGDLVKYLPDGSLAFITRIDNQVKIRGFRIELGEIESVLSTYPGIKDAIVIVKEDTAGEKILVAFYTTKTESEIISAQLRDFLQLKLPDYMIPSVLAKLNEVPLTANNKVDRRALASSVIPAGEEDLDFVAPVTEHEIRLAKIWKEILKIDKVGIRSEFFELGGHSLTAVQMITRIKKEFNVDIPFRAIFKRLTISGLVRHIESYGDAGDGKDARIQHLSTPHNEYPLSSSQSRIWFMEKFDPGMVAYNLPLDYKISGELDVDLLNQTLSFLIGRHESLRTVFPEVNGKPVQKVLAEVPANLSVIHLEKESREAIPALIAQYSLANAGYRFSLSTGPLFRFQLLILGNREFVFLINLHHIISDAISLGIILDEIKKVYHSLLNHHPVELPAIPVTYTDFTQWQNEWLRGEEYRNQVAFWKTELAGAPELLQLPLDFHRPKTTTYNGSEYHFSLDPELKGRLATLSNNNGTGLSMPLLSAFAILLNRYSLQDDFVLGFPVANRMSPELELLTGVFINSLPVRFTFPEEITFSELVRNTMNRFLSAHENQQIPIERIVDELKVKRSMNNNPVFQVIFNYLAGFPTEFQLPGSVMTLLRGERISSQVDLTLTVNDEENGLNCVFEYNTNLFREETIARMAGHYLTLLGAVTENENLDTRSVPLLTNPENRLMLEEWNNTRMDYPAGKCIHELFEDQVRKTPDSIAVVFENEELTYRDLNAMANRLANYLLRQGAKEGTVVAICMRRSIDLLAGLLAISKTGATYLPLDPIYPKARLSLILEDAKPALVLSESSLAGSLPETESTIIFLENREVYSGEPSGNLTYGNAQNTAYLLYTSGSTGKPKGVQIKHHSVINLVCSMGKLLKVTAEDILLAETTISFDIAELEMYLPLFAGARLVIATESAALNVELLKEKIEESGATLFQATPVTFKMLVLSGWKGKQDLKLICGGEAFSQELASQLLTRCKEVWNGYGPTETTIYSVVKKIGQQDCNGDGYVPIGRPLDNTRVYVLNSKLVPVPVGVTGELYIGGDGVSTGYLNLPEMTGQRFIPDLFDRKPESRIYKTGDLVKYFADGTLLYLERADSQVKIRGFRIELGEIESAIAQYRGIKENVVVVREDIQGEKILVAYCVTDNFTLLDEAGLRLHLKEKLPDYMVPAAIVTMEKLPLTANNKVDRKALPEPANFSSAVSKEYVEPKTLTEKKLVTIWSSILKIERIGIRDDFFEIGGHSMIAVTMIIQIEKEFGIRLPLATLFDQTNIQSLAKVIEDGITPDKWRSLVTLRQGGSKKPLFLVHGLGLNVLLYTTVINHLDPEQPVYGLQAKGLNGIDQPLKTIEEIAAYYISEILTVDPQGPYRLAGYSLGGIIAFEMGRQLKEMGKDVNFIGLLDTVAEGSVRRLPLRGQIVSRSRYLVNYLFWNIAYFFKASGESKFSKFRRRWRGLSKKVRGIDIKVSKDDRVSKGEQRELPEYLHKVHRANLRAGRMYILKPYEGRVDLFKAAHQTFYIVDPVNYGWDKYASGGVVIHEIPGEHSSTFAPPNDKHFASILQRSIDETRIQS